MMVRTGVGNQWESTHRIQHRTDSFTKINARFPGLLLCERRLAVARLTGLLASRGRQRIILSAIVRNPHLARTDTAHTG